MTLLSRGLVVAGPAAEAQPFVVIELVIAALGLVVVDVVAVLQAQSLAPGQEDGRLLLEWLWP